MYPSKFLAEDSLTDYHQIIATNAMTGCNSTMRVSNCTSCLQLPSCVWCMPNLNSNSGSSSFCAYQSQRNSMQCQGAFVAAGSGSVCEMKSLSISNVSVVLMTIFVTACCCSCFTSLCYCLMRSFSKSQRRVNPMGNDRIEEAEAQWVSRRLSTSHLCLTVVSADPGYAVAIVDSVQSRDQSSNFNSSAPSFFRHFTPSGRRFSADCNSVDRAPIAPLTVEDDVSLYTRSNSFSHNQTHDQEGQVRALSVRILSHLTQAATESLSTLSSSILPRQPIPTATFVPSLETGIATPTESGTRLESRQV